MEQEEKAEKKQRKEDDPLKWLPLVDLFEGMFKCISFILILAAIILIYMVAGGDYGMSGALATVLGILFFTGLLYYACHDAKANMWFRSELKLRELAANQPPLFLYCSHCGWRNDGRANFCNRCGANLHPNSAVNNSL